MSDAKKPTGDQPAPAWPTPDLEALSRNSARFVEEAGKATAALMKPLERGEAKGGVADEVSDIVKTLGQVAEKVMMNPQKAIEAQAAIGSGFLTLWAETLKKMQGEAAQPVAEADPRDPRFADPEWKDNPVFDFIKQAYLLTSRWANDVVEKADGMDEHTRDKARFYMKQLSSALSPSNFLATNPELIRQTFAQNGENLVRGMQMLAEDVDAGKGELKVRMTDTSRFEVGVNMAVTPGKVVFRNELIELIQYAPTTETVLARPLVIVPPWINKFYILDLNPEKSFIRWCVDQGLTVFCVSWINPDERHRAMGFDDYMRQGVLKAVEVACEITGSKDVSAIGYCVGGTMLAVTLAYMAAVGDSRISSATFFTTQVDFENAGELKVFVDEEQIRSIEEQMKLRGYLDGARMAARSTCSGPTTSSGPTSSTCISRASRPSRSTCSTGTPTPRACRRRTIRSTCATAIWRTSSRRARCASAASGSTSARSRSRSTTSRRARTTSRRPSPCSRAAPSSAGRSTTCWRAPATSPASSTRRPR